MVTYIAYNKYATSIMCYYCRDLLTTSNIHSMVQYNTVQHWFTIRLHLAIHIISCTNDYMQPCVVQWLCLTSHKTKLHLCGGTISHNMPPFLVLTSRVALLYHAKHVQGRCFHYCLKDKNTQTKHHDQV